jgi:5'-nucleotidase/UDP-sugar diphosphatase
MRFKVMSKLSRKSSLLLSLSVVVLLIAAIASCGKEEPRSITILHTNDMHGHFLPEPATWLDDKPMVGGFAALDYYINQERGIATNSLLMDAGDLMTGNPICDMQYEGADGGALIAMMNMMGYDCMVPGNHEFDKPADNARKLFALADFSVVCANLVDSAGQEFCKEAYHIFNVNGLRVGVIGITYYQLYGMAKPENLEGFYSTDPVETVNRIVPEIDDLTDLIIVLSHLGIENDRDLAKHIKNVDVIVGGHSHTLIKEPEVVNGVIIVQAGSYARDLGLLDLQVAGDTVYSYEGKLITTFAEGTKADPKLQSLIDSFAVVIDSVYGKVIGNLGTPWESAYRSESNIGDWITDVMREQTGADVAFINSGGIRKDIAAGPITLRDIAEMLPFQNYVETFECTGSQLRDIFVENATAEGVQTHGILQLSGASYTWSKTGEKITIEQALVGGKKLIDDKVYKVASIDYVNGNFERYYKFKPENLSNTGILLSDMAIDAVKKAGTIDSKIENRIKQAE